MFLLAKYGTQTSFRFAVIKSGSSDLAASGDWTPATGDTKISKDGGNFANTSNKPSAVGGTGSVGWTLTLTATELQAAEVNVQIVDSATKAIEDQYLVIYTYGNASAKILPDLGNSVLNANVVQILGTAVTETVAGYIAAGFKKLFDVATPVLTAASVNQTGDSYAKVDTEIAAIKAKTDLIPASPAQEGTLSTIEGKVDSILADTDMLQTDLVNGGRLDLLVDGIKAKTDLIPASPAQEGTLSTIEGKVDSVLADTNMLQVDWVNGGRLDLLIDGIKAKTDLIPASPAAVGSKMDIVDAPSSAGKTALANAAADQVWDEVASGHVASGSAGALLGLVHSILGGKQQIIGNQLVCYAADNATEVARFNLFDSDGDPTMVAVYLRTRV